MSGRLYLVASPIGNLRDISSRFAEVLTSVDLIACEDTRITSRLLGHLNITVPLTSYREENERGKSIELCHKMQQGQSIALLSDAGYPSISDPGFRLVRECHMNDIQVVPIPGPNAAITALAASGLPTHQFLFLGFFPKKKNAVLQVLEEWKDFSGSLVFYESKYKIAKTLELIQSTYGEERLVCVTRELTKVHESIISGPIKIVRQAVSEKSTKGEFTLVIAPTGYQFESTK
jgi:16S rRNA (cytidine1402-2'-O)-methyltransferase